MQFRRFPRGLTHRRSRPIRAALGVTWSLCVVAGSSPSAAATLQSEWVGPSCCHVYIDYQFIWTLEMVPDASGQPVPVLNIITLLEGQWDLRPRDIHLRNGAGQEARIDRFAVDTGVPGEPFLTPYLKVHGDSFIGLDLVGDFTNFAEPAEVTIDLGDFRFGLQAVDRLEFENLVQRISQINLESPDLRDDFRVLSIHPMGKREYRRRYY